jgi:hypothetical protein
MNEMYDRKTVVDIGIRPNVYDEWDVFELRVYNFVEFVSNYLAPDQGWCSGQTFYGDKLNVELHSNHDGSLFFISTQHTGIQASKILKIRDIDGKVLFEKGNLSRLDKRGPIVLEVKFSSIVGKSSKVLRDGHLIVELWMKLVCGRNNHSHLFRPKNPLRQNILNLYSEEAGADVFFDVKEGNESRQIISAHLLVLKASAPTLAALCKGYDKTTPVPITDVKCGVFNLVLYYAYGGAVSTSNLEKYSKELMEAADRYEVPNLKVEAEGFYVKLLDITVDKFVEIYQNAEAKNYPLVKEACILFFLKNGLKVLETSTYIEAAKTTTIGNDLLLHMVSSSHYGRGVDGLRRELNEKGLSIDGSRRMMEELLKKSIG